MEYTYFFSRNDFWYDTDFYTTFDVGVDALQCNGDGKYVRGGDILFPPSWDTEEKRKAAVLKSYRGRCRFTKI